jgi:two-component sensor histidine kinase
MFDSKKAVFFLLFFFLFSTIFAGTVVGQNRALRVGVYQDYPMVFVENNNPPEGIFIDVLEEIARREKWKIDYVLSSFAEGLAALREGKIDLLTVVAESKERKEKYDFNQETVLPTWGQIYSEDPSQFQSLLDLDNKKLAVVKNDIYYQTLQPTIKRFEIDVNYLEMEGVEEYTDMFKAVSARRADALLVNHLFGHFHAGEFAVQKTPIVCCPAGLKFAFPKNTSQKLIEVIDDHLRELKNNSQSIYYQSLNHWLNEQTTPLIPAWLWWLIGIAAGSIVLLGCFVLLLHYEVERKTKFLKQIIADKDALLHEVFHRVKNNLQMVLSFLEMESMQNDNKEATVPLERSMNRIQSLTIIHNLIYDVDNLSEIPVHDYLKKLIVTLTEDTEINKNIRTSFELEDIYLGIDRTISLGMITSEIISNSLQYAFENVEKPKIKIKLQKHNNTIRLILSDNGPGCPRDINPMKTSSLGFTLIRGITEKELQGKIDFNCTKGTEIIIEFAAQK